MPATECPALGRHLAPRQLQVPLSPWPVREITPGQPLAGPGASVVHIRPFLLSTGITLDEQLALDLSEEAGRSYEDDAARRKTSGGGWPRRLAAFVVGAHAHLTCAQLATLDPQHSRQACPAPSVLVPRGGVGAVEGLRSSRPPSFAKADLLARERRPAARWRGPAGRGPGLLSANSWCR
ncbi:hypothetical protein [Deinococcus planocerae]|uniref:hypothetical protein n=1 Tax=Deinococcus planocerae TaxID=1737569 RepID=UPI0011AF35B2|nr:hypothetical protein [Deinococcus planocerae]